MVCSDLSGTGNRLARRTAEHAEAMIKEAVDLRITNGEIVIAPIRAKKYRLEELVSAINSKNRHPEVVTGKRLGREAW